MQDQIYKLKQELSKIHERLNQQRASGIDNTEIQQHLISFESLMEEKIDDIYHLAYDRGEDNGRLFSGTW